MVKKKDDPGSRNNNEDNLGKEKLTFTPAVSKTWNVRERILSFQELSVKNECVIDSGSSAMHNVKCDNIVDTVRRCYNWGWVFTVEVVWYHAPDMPNVQSRAFP